MIALIPGVCLEEGAQLLPTKIRCFDNQNAAGSYEGPYWLRSIYNLDQFAGFLGIPFQSDDCESTVFCLVCTVELCMNDTIIRHGLFNGKNTVMKIRRQSFIPKSTGT